MTVRTETRIISGKTGEYGEIFNLKDLQINIVSPDEFASITPDLDLYRQHVYALYTPDGNPTEIKSAKPENHITAHYIVARHPYLQSILSPGDNPRLQKLAPGLAPYSNVAGFFRLEDGITTSGNLPIEAMTLVAGHQWPHNEHIGYCSQFAPNPLLPKYLKLLVLRELLTKSFEYATENGFGDHLYVILADHVNTFVTEAGIDTFQLPGASLNWENPAAREIFTTFPRYWGEQTSQNPPRLYLFQPRDQGRKIEVSNPNAPYRTDRFITVIDPSNPESATVVQNTLAHQSPEQRSQMLSASISDWEELWKLTNPRQPFLEFVQQHAAIDSYNWAIDKSTGQLMIVPTKEDYHRIFTSRAFPLLSHQELAKVNQATASIFGLSTGAELGERLVEFGIGKLIGADPDTVSTSNLQRLVYATRADVCRLKAQVFGERIAGKNPYVELVLYHHRLSSAEIEATLTESDVTVDMMDDLPSKVALRQISKKIYQDTCKPVPVVMATNVGWTPIITIEDPSDPLFLQPDTSNLLDLIHNPNCLPSQRIHAIIDLIGKKYLPQRTILNLVLAANGKVPYLAQHGANAAGAGYVAAHEIVKLLNGSKSHRSRIIIDLPTLSDSSDYYETSDAQLLLELTGSYPDLFPVGQDNTLTNAIDRLYQSTFSSPK